MAEQVGTAEVAVTANVTDALTKLDSIGTKMAELSRQATELGNKLSAMGQGGAPNRDKDGSPRGQGAPPGTRERAQGDAALTPQVKGDINVEGTVTVSGASIISQIETALKGHTFTLRVTIDTRDIQAAINNAGAFTINAQGGGGQQQQQAQYKPSGEVLAAIQETQGALKEMANIAAPIKTLQAAAGGKMYEPKSTEPAELARMVESFFSAVGAKAGMLDEMASQQTLSNGKVRNIPGASNWMKQLAEKAAANEGVNQNEARSNLSIIRPLLTSTLQHYQGYNPPQPVYQQAPQQQPQQAPSFAQTIAQAATTTPSSARMASQVSGLKLQTTPEERDRVQTLREEAQKRMQEERERLGNASNPRTWEEIAKGVEQTYRDQGLAGARQSGRQGPEYGVSTGLGGRGARWDAETGEFLGYDGSAPSVRTKLDKQGRVVNASTRTRRRDEEQNLLPGFEFEGVNLTPLARLASTGILSDFMRDNETGEIRLAPQKNGKADFSGGQRIGAQESLKRLIRASVGGPIDNKVLDQMIRGRRKGEGALAGDLTGYFAPFLAEGTRQRQLINQGDTGGVGDMNLNQRSLGSPTRNADGTYSFTGASVAEQELYDLQNLTGEPDRPYDTVVDPDLAANRVKDNQEARDALRNERGQRSEQYSYVTGPDGKPVQQLADLTVDQLGQVIGARAEITRAGELPTEQFLSEMEQVFESLLTRDIPETAEEFGGLDPQTGQLIQKGDPLDMSRFINNSVARVMRASGLGQAYGIGHLLPTPGAMSKQFRGKGGGLISSMLDAVTGKYYQQRDDENQAGVAAGSRETALETKARRAASQRLVTLRARSKLDELETRDSLTSQEGTSTRSKIKTDDQIINEWMRANAPKEADRRAYGDRREKAPNDSPAPQPSDFEAGKTPAEIFAAAERATAPERLKARAEREDLEGQKVFQQGVLDLAEKMAEVATTPGNEDMLNAVPTKESLLALATEAGGKDVDNKTRDQAIEDVFRATRGGQRGPIKLSRVFGNTAQPFSGNTDPSVGSVYETDRAPGDEFRRGYQGTPERMDEVDSPYVTGDEFAKMAAKTAGHLVPGQGQFNQQSMDAAMQAASNLNGQQGAAAMVVTIAGPLPLPVTIAGGSIGGPPPKDTAKAQGQGDGGGRESVAAEKADPYKPVPKKDTIFVSPGGRLGRTPGPTESYDERVGTSLPFRPTDGAPGIFRSATGEISQPGVRLPALQNAKLPPLPGIQYEEQLLLPAQATNARARGAAPLDTMGNAQRPVAAFGQDSAVVLEQKDRDLRMKAEANERTAAEREASKPKQTEEERKALAARAPTAARLDQLLRTGAEVDKTIPGAGGLPMGEFDESVYEEQGYQVAQQGARASLRQARGRLPQRALSTSIVQIAENLFGGLEKPLARIAEAEQEFTQLGQIGRQRGKVEGDLQLKQVQRDVVGERIRREKNLDAQGNELPEDQRKPPTLDKKQIDELEASFASLGEEIELDTRSLAKLTELEDEQAKKVQELADGAVGAGDVLRNLGAGFIGGVGGAMVSQMVSQVAGAIIMGFQLALPTLDRNLGGARVAAAETQKLAQAFTQGGFSQTAMREQLATTGFTSATTERFDETVNPNARAVALANQMDAARDLLFTEQAIEGQMAQGSPESQGILPAYYQQVGGFKLGPMEWGGSDSPVKVFAGMLKDSFKAFDEDTGISQRDLGQAQWELGETRKQYPDATPEELELMARSGQAFGGVSAVTNDKAWDSVFGDGPMLSDRLMEVFGDQLNGTGFGIQGGTDADQLATIGALGGQAGNLVSALKEGNITLTQDGKPLTVDDLDDFLNATQGGSVEGSIDYQNLAKIMGESIPFQNSMWMMGQDQARQVEMNRMGSAMEGMANVPLTASQARAPISSNGFGRAYRDLRGDVREFEQQGKEMLTSLMPDELVTEFTDLGKQLQALSAESAQIGRTQAWRNYQMQIKQAKYQVEDLQGLVGKAGGSEVGYLERQNMLLQRKLQLLQFEQQQRAINFGVAVAGFQSAGLTGEERAGRLEVARKEAAIQQEMLDANKQIFGNQVQIVDMQNVRSLQMATLNLRNVAASFRENSRLSEIGTMSELIGRRQKQIATQFEEQKQFWAQADQALAQFNKDLGDRTQTLADSVELQVASTGTFHSGLDKMTNQNDRLRQLIDEGTTPGLIVRDIKIDVASSFILEKKQLIDMLITEMGKYFERLGG